MSIKNPTLVHFRHFKHFSSLLTNLPSTTVESVLQNHLFLQNKANFPDAQMNVNSILTKDYVNKSNWKVRKNKANTKPNKANLLKAKMNVTTFLTKEYENKSNWTLGENEPKTNPIRTQTNPIKANFRKSQNECKLICYKGL